MTEPDDKVRTAIIHPTLRAAYDADWYYPWTPPPEVTKSAEYQLALREGWAEWIESPADFEAVKDGYGFDLSRDKNGEPVYWFSGEWVRYGGNGELVSVDSREIGYLGYSDRICRFAEKFLFFSKDPLTGEPYRFLDWTRKLVQVLFGWVRRNVSDSNIKYRRYREAIIEIAKKNSKSDLASVLSVFLVRGDKIPKAYVFGAATSRSQARIVYDESASYVRSSPTLKAEIDPVDSRGRLNYYANGSYFQVISADAFTAEGLDAHGVIIDELHKQKNRRLWSVLKKAGQARMQPLRIVITTYGNTLNSIWGEVHLDAKSHLSGKKTNYRKLVWIASAEPITVVTTKDAKKGDTRLEVYRLEQPVDPDQVLEFELSEKSAGKSVKTKVKLSKGPKRYQWFMECEPLKEDIPAFSEAVANREWATKHGVRRANPSVNIIFDEQTILDNIAEVTSPADEADLKQLNFNIVSGGVDGWISGAAWEACTKEALELERFKKKWCYGGLDISFTNDLTAFWLAIPNWPRHVKFSNVESPRVRLVGMVWLPSERIEEREELANVAYRHYAKQIMIGGLPPVRICEGAAINYKQVADDIKSLCQMFRVQAIAYDARFADFIIEPYLDKSGVRCIEHRQGALSMGPPTKRFEELVKKAWLLHGSHPVLDAAIDGAKLKEPDDVGNRYPSKKKSISRIDPVIAAIMATGWACNPPISPASAWSGKDGTGSF